MVLACWPGTATAVDVLTSSVQINKFNGRAVGEPVGKLIWRGGIEIKSRDDTFGGLSGLAFASPKDHFVFVSDRGNFVTGQLLYDEYAQLFGLIGVAINPIPNSRGTPLPRPFARDAEAISTIETNGLAVGIRVGFENLTRVAEFELRNAKPFGPAKEVVIPQWLSNTRTNRSLESVCVAPSNSALAGSTLLITEGAIDSAGNRRAELVGPAHSGALSYQPSLDLDPTDCTFLPNGDLLVLERGLAFASFTMNLRLIAAEDVKPGAILHGTVILSGHGDDIDNMEALAVHTAPDGETRIVIGSDNNFNALERTILLEFAMPQQDVP